MPRYFCQKNIENSLEESKILQDFSSVKPLQSKLFTTESPEENRGVKSIRDWFIIHTYQNHKWQTMQSRFAPFRKHKTEHFLKAEHQFPIENFVDTTSANSNKTEFAFCVRTNPVILFTNCFWISGNDKDEHSIYLKIQRSDKKPIPIAAAHTNYFPATTRVKTSGHFVVTISPYGVFELFSSVNIPVILDYNQLVKWCSPDISDKERFQICQASEDNNYTIHRSPFTEVIDKTEKAYKNLDLLHYGPLF